MLSSRRTATFLIAFTVANDIQAAGAQRVASSQVASVGVAPLGTAGPVEPEPVSVVLELRIGDLASITVPGYRVDDEALIPLTVMLRLAEVQHTLNANGTLEAAMQPGNVSVVIAVTHDVMSHGARRVTIRRDLRIFRGGELYLSARAFGDLLRLPMVVDWSDLTVTITDPRSLPVARRIAREDARRRLLRQPDPATGPALAYALRRPPVDGLVLDYTINAPSSDLKASSYSVAAGMNVLGGSLEGVLAGAGLSSGQGLRYTGGWTGVWADNAWVRQVRLGDAVSTGVSPRLLRGGTVTNSPYLRPTRFGVDGFRGVLAPGWEIEAYRGGQLISYDSADAIGRYAIPIPTEYGENPLEFVAYGPFGEVRHFNRLYRVAGELVPARQFEYGMSAGQCGSALCTGTANVDLRYGLSSRWTIRAGYDGFQRDSLPMLSHPYASVAGSLTDAVGVQVDAVMRASARALLRYEPSTRLRLAGEYTQYDLADSIPILTPAGWRARWLVSALVRPRGASSATYVEGDAAFVETLGGSTLRARLITSGQWRDVRVSPYARLERDARVSDTPRSRTFFGLSTWVMPRTKWRLLGHTSLRATVEAERQGGTSDASVAITRQFARGVRIEAGGRWTRTTAVATLLTAIDLAAVRSYTSTFVPRNGTPTTSQFLQGSVVVNTAARQIALEAGPSLQRSGVAGRVFLDQNSNGQLDRGEPILPNVTVRVGAWGSESNSKGRYEVWNLTPYEPTIVTVDSASLPSPLWIPRFAVLTVVPGPNRFVLADVPIVPAGAVEGRVVLEDPDGRLPIGNARLALIDDQTGVRQVITTFGDGEFVAIGVRPGRYAVAVDERLLTRLQATQAPTRFTLQPSADGTTVRGIEVVLRRANPQR
jgi:hypothetical protein